MIQIDTAINILEQIHDGKTHIGEYLKLIFHNFPISIFWKDKDSVYEGLNAISADYIGYKNPDSIIGKSDLDCCLKEKEAIAFQRDDQKVMQSGKPIFNIIEPLHKRNGESQMICTTKIPVYDSEQCISGVVGFFSNISISSNIDLLHASNEHLKSFCLSLKNTKSYYLILDDRTIKLTAKQAECLTHLAMGKTIKQISNMLECSSRTIEDHIHLLKRKLGVYSTVGLIDCFWRNPIKWF